MQFAMKRVLRAFILLNRLQAKEAVTASSLFPIPDTQEKLDK